MNKLSFIVIGFISCSFLFAQTEVQKKDKEINKKVEILLKEMTLKEKVGQMSMIDVSTFIKRVDPHGPSWGPMAEPHTLDKDSLQKYVINYKITKNHHQKRF